MHATQPVTALHCGHLIDTGAGTVLGATTIVIEGKRVRAVSDGSAAVPGATEIDLHDQTCLSIEKWPTGFVARQDRVGKQSRLRARSRGLSCQ
jgi:hypothetical protein